MRKFSLQGKEPCVNFICYGADGVSGWGTGQYTVQTYAWALASLLPIKGLWSRVNGLSGRADVQAWINLMPASCIQFHSEQNNDTLEWQVSSPDVWRRMETFLCSSSGGAGLLASKKPDVALVHLFLVCIFSGCLSTTNVFSLSRW